MKKTILISLLIISFQASAGLTFSVVEVIQTEPSHPRIDQSFDLVVKGRTNGCTGADIPTINAQTITLNIRSSFCPPHIDPFPLISYRFQIQGLQAGQYKIEIYEHNNLSGSNEAILLGTSGVFVGPRPVPALRPLGVMLMVALFLIASAKMSYNKALKSTPTTLRVAGSI